MRTETKEFKIYKFEELSEEVQEKVIEKNRHTYVEYDGWWDSVYEWFYDTAVDEGFDATKIYFSGFWSQGDGAMFEGELNNNIYENLTPQYGSEEYKKDFNRVLHLLKTGQIDIFGRFQQFGHYYHKKSYTDSLEWAFNNDWQGKNYSNIESILDDMIDSIRLQYEELACNLYRQLEQEYDYLTSHEVIRDSLIENDYEYLEDGEYYI